MLKAVRVLAGGKRLPHGCRSGIGEGKCAQILFSSGLGDGCGFWSGRNKAIARSSNRGPPLDNLKNAQPDKLVQPTVGLDEAFRVRRQNQSRSVSTAQKPPLPVRGQVDLITQRHQQLPFLTLPNARLWGQWLALRSEPGLCGRIVA